MANYEEARGKLTNIQLYNLKSENKKIFQNEELPHELFLRNTLATIYQQIWNLVKLNCVQ